MDEEAEIQPNLVIATSNGNPVRLFRNKQQLIEANLAGVKASVIKKQIAQQHFYDDNQSPLKRQYADNRGPVHRRLGKRVILHRNNGPQYARRFTPYNHFGLVRMKRGPHHSQQFRLNGPRDGMTRLYSANYMRSIPPKVLLRQNTRWLERSAATQNLQAAGGHLPSNPLNYTIEIQNSNTQTPTNSYYPPTLRHSIRAQLNPSLQEQIHSVQAECVSVSLSPIDIIPTLPGGATKITMHDRFTSLG